MEFCRPVPRFPCPKKFWKARKPRLPLWLRRASPSGGGRVKTRWPRSTANYWSDQPEVRREVETLRRRSIDRALGRMASRAPAAVDGIAKLAKGAETTRSSSGHGGPCCRTRLPFPRRGLGWPAGRARGKDAGATARDEVSARAAAGWNFGSERSGPNCGVTISLPFEGVPASLVPGLRTAVGEIRRQRGSGPGCAELEHALRTSSERETPSLSCPCARR